MMDYFDIIKASSGIPVNDPWAMLWAQSISEEDWQLTTLTGTLPLTFQSKGSPLTDYKLYGTSEGAGVETESGEPSGYKLPMTMESGEESTTTPIYIGDSKLMAEEYVDYGKQKVHKRTENLFDKNKVEVFEHTQISRPNIWIRYDGVAKVYRYPCEPNATYSISVFAESTIFRISMIATDDIPGQTYGASVVINDIVKQANTQPVTFTTSSNAKYLLMQVAAYVQDDLPNILAIVKGSTPPETYIPYLQPTDPPVSLPELSTYQGENTLSCSEGLGEVSVTGYIKEASQ